MLVTLLISFFMCRIPPLSKKESVYLDGHIQTPEEIAAEKIPVRDMLKIGSSRAVKEAATAPNLLKEIAGSLKDSCFVLPKVISLLTAAGVTAMMIATYTPLFHWLGKLFEPLLFLCRVPDAAIIAPSLPVGIAEMFLPVLLSINAFRGGTLHGRDRIHGTDYFLLGNHRRDAFHKDSREAEGAYHLLLRKDTDCHSDQRPLHAPAVLNLIEKPGGRGKAPPSHTAVITTI